MKKKITVSLIIAAVAIIIGAICILATRNTDTIETADTIYPASEQTGWIEEKIIGNPDEAKVIIYEYADFGCSHCAEANKTINSLMEKYDGKIALVFRHYDIGQFPNTPTAARAATAAQIQGYFKEYKDLLFNNQAEWYYADKSELTDLFTEYFARASNNKGDLEKFQQDFSSDAVKTRLQFERKLGQKANLHGTPLFRIDGEQIPPSDLTETITQKLVE